MQDKYVLDERGEPKPEPDLIAWGQWFQKAERHVGDDSINGSRVSTVFLGLDHDFTGKTPLLWETMVFGGSLNEETDRCGGSREQAEAMHKRMVERVKAAESAAAH